VGRPHPRSEIAALRETRGGLTLIKEIEWDMARKSARLVQRALE